MRLVLDGFTAYEYWMSAAYADGAQLVRAPHPELTNFEGSERGELAKAIATQEGYDGKLQLLVQNASQRRPSSYVDCRCWSSAQPLPPNSLYRIGANIFVESPELCLVRLATELPRFEFFRALSDMLGIYGFSITNRTDLIKRSPITTIDKIRTFLDHIPGVRGTRLVSQALKWIVPRAGSPRETSVDLSLAMPTITGGHNLPQFEANYSISLTAEAKPLTQKSYLIADVMWKDKKRALEYNSDKYHDTEEQKEYDFEKITALKRMGCIVYPVSTRQFNDYNAFFSIVQDLCKDLGVRITTSEAAQERRRKAHEELLRIERRNRELPSIAETARWQYLMTHIDLDTS